MISYTIKRGFAPSAFRLPVLRVAPVYRPKTSLSLPTIEALHSLIHETFPAPTLSAVYLAFDVYVGDNNIHVARDLAKPSAAAEPILPQPTTRTFMIYESSH
jgi:hypothetical protein